tara:strand:+ start:11898 stop:12710 length:813 start_codon:yes stop_codon:yes gene_type:complete
MPELILEAFESSVTMATSGTLAATAVPAMDVSAAAVFMVDVASMQSVFQFQTDSTDLLDASASDIKYYIDSTNFPTVIAGNAMMDNAGSTGAIASGFAANKSLLCHDFTRYLATKLFGTHHGVELFNNEPALLTNLRTITGSGAGNAMATVTDALALVNLTGTHAGMATDGNGDKYMTNATTTNANLGKILFEQLTSTVPARFATLSDSNAKQAMPLLADDILSFKITINAATGQENLTSVSAIPARTYKIKLLMKATADIANTTVDANE